VSERLPLVSIVIPTHNRLPVLRQCLSALASQRYPRDRMEVIVVADGCTDGTGEALSNEPQPLPLQVLTQPGRGAAAARNRGAVAARGEILLFLDDDVIASEGLVAAHASAHPPEEDERVVVGPYLLDPPTGSDYLQEALSGFWHRLFEGMSVPGHVPDHSDVVAGNLSTPARTFHRIGGFSEAFPACGVEDYELGVRLLSGGVQWYFAPDAHARHLETTDLRRSAARNRRGGAAAVTLVRLHPHLLSTTRLAEPAGPARRMAFRTPRFGAILSEAGILLLHVVQGLRFRKLWRFLYARLRSYWFWSGVRDEIRTEEKLHNFLLATSEEQTSPPRPVSSIAGASEPALPSAPPIAAASVDGPRPLWSVMIPTYNCADFLRLALSSVLAQDPGSDRMQIEVIDDASTRDDPESVARELGSGRVGFYRQPTNMGHVSNFNTCIRRARGQLVHILHGDDMALAGFYETMERPFQEAAEIGAAFCRDVRIDAAGDTITTADALAPTSGVLPNWLETIAKGQCLQPPAMVVRRSVYETLGGFDRRISCYGEDWEMWVRIASRYPVWYIPRPLAAYRVHGSSLTAVGTRTGAHARDYRRVIDINRAHLPPQHVDEWTHHATVEFGKACMRRGWRWVLAGRLRGAYHHFLEGLRTDRSFPVFREFVEHGFRAFAKATGRILERLKLRTPRSSRSHE